MVHVRPSRFAMAAAGLALGCLNLATVATIAAQGAPTQTPPGTPDITTPYEAPQAGDDYARREVMIPMRDGVKLHTVIVVPKDAKGAPMILTRTPYNASGRAARHDSPHMLATL